MTLEELEAIAINRSLLVRSGLHAQGLGYFLCVYEITTGKAATATSMTQPTVAPFLEAILADWKNGTCETMIRLSAREANQLTAATLAKKDQNEGC